MASRKKEMEINITGFEFPNKGISNYEGVKVVIKGTIPDQKILARLSKKKGVYHGHAIRVLQKSPIEIDPKCVDFWLCGGCAHQNLLYEDELRLKQQMIEGLLTEFLGNGVDFLGIEGAEPTEGYRNKMEYSFGDKAKGGELALGMRKRNSYYEVVTSTDCTIVDTDFQQIVKTVLAFFKNTNETFFHKFSNEGVLRHLVVRKGFFTDEVLVNLVTTSKLTVSLDPLTRALSALSSNIVGILHTINDSPADAVKVDECRVLMGQDYFYEKLLGLRFKISAFSFFQTNSFGAERLYTTVKEFAGNLKDQVVFDLYCGTGTIAQILAQDAKSVVGIELVEEAVLAARQNAELNQIHNCRFIVGDVMKKVDELDCTPDLIVLDPPREGIHAKALDKIIAFQAEQIIYISCKPTSLQRDLHIFLANGYRLMKIRCHDLFPRTYHVETVVLLMREGC